MNGLKKLSACAPPAAVLAAGLALSLPVWLRGWTAAGDAVFHASWLAHFDAQLRAGELYPRWLAGMNGGLGSPAFYYYPPLPYYFASLIKLFVPAGEHGLRALGAAAALAYAASGLAAYVWLKQLARTRSAAAVAAVVYLLAPYHSAVNLYTREAYAELWAFVWMPLALKFARALAAADPTLNVSTPNGAAHGSIFVKRLLGSGFFRRLRRSSFINRLLGSDLAKRLTGSSPGLGSDFRLNFAGLAVAYGLLAASHPPAVLIFSPLLGACALLSARGLRAVLASAAALLLGAGLAAAYLLPALALQDAASFDAMLAFNYFERWLTFARADARTLDGLLLWGTLTTLALTACAALLRDTSRTGGARREMVFWIVAAALSALMMTSASDPLWRALPALQRVQFPWRFNLLLTLAAAAAVALGLGHARGARLSRRMLVFAGLLVAAWLVLAASTARRVYTAVGGQTSLVAADARAAFAHGRDAPEYRPRWSNLADEQAVRQALLRACAETLADVRACVERGEGSALLRRNGPRELEIVTDSGTGLELRVTQFYFPGWTARLDDRTHPLRASSPDGLIALSVPPGPHTLRLALEPTRPERAGLLVSAASLALLLAVLALPHARRPPTPSA